MILLSNPTRAPTKEEVREYYEQNNVSLKECANHFGISENTVKSWKKRDKAKGDDWVHLIDSSGAPKGAEGKSKKQLINKAKSMVIQGATIKEASEKTGVKESTLQNYSSKENWIEQQERFLKNVYGRLQEEEEYLKKDCDYRFISYGTIRLIAKNEKTRVQELKINFKVKRNFKYILEKYIKEKANISVSAANISKQDIVDLIYDNYPELRAN